LVSLVSSSFVKFLMPQINHVPGLGAMGYAMASNIRKKMPATGTLYINDISHSCCDRFVDEFSNHGFIRIVDSAREAAENSKVVISIIPGAGDVQIVYLAQNTGVIAARPDPERLMLECSTIDSQSTREIGEALHAAGLGTYVDSPVSVGL
jgi:3-hydroxyisobutyrate dehydrogenase